MKKTDLRGAPERRALPMQFELRASGANTLTLTGYASVFESPYDIMGGPPYGFTETVDPGAFDQTLKANPDVHLLINHAGMPLARTKSGTMTLAKDSTGLHVEAGLDLRDPEVQALQVKMGRGDIDEMSFAFRTIRDLWTEEETQRRLLEVNIDKGDVSVVNFGANPATSVSLQRALRSLAEGDETLLAEMHNSGVDLAAVQRSLGQLLRQSRSRKGVLSVAEAMALLDS